jgi:hypothetical protein
MNLLEAAHAVARSLCVMLDQPRELARSIERFASRTETAPVALR